MNYRYISNLLGRILLIGGALMLIPTLISVFSQDKALMGFIIADAALLAFGGLLFSIKAKGSLYSREGFVIVVLSWVLMSVFGALPFVISGYIPNFFSAFFEVVSGFTTTGSTILTDIEALPKSLLFWRSFTHWIGGMGILVFMLAVMPKSNARMMHVMKAEVPGPKVDKLVARTRVTAQILYCMYLALSVIETIFLLCGGLSFFDALTVTFSTAGTGGFASYNASIAAFNSVYVEVVVTVFMFLFSINFNLYYLAIIGQIGRAVKSEELRWFVGIVAVAIGIITLNILSVCGSFAEALRYSSFQVVSVMSTSGFITADFIQWPQLSQTVLLILMFIGACVGSTGGGIKVGRIMILIKSGIREIRRLLTPNTVLAVRIDKKPVEEAVVSGSAGFLAVYTCLMLAATLLISFDGFDFTTNFTSVVTCINNIGPTLGNVIGATGNFSVFSDFSKVVLSFCMLAGRLNIFPVVMLLSPSTWKKAA